MNIKVLMVCCFMTNIAFAENFVVNQQNLAFSKDSLNIKVNDTVTFVNQDEAFHNVYSLSDAAFFDLGSYGKGVSKDVEFDEVGEVVVECAVHPAMQMIINVVE